MNRMKSNRTDSATSTKVCVAVYLFFMVLMSPYSAKAKPNARCVIKQGGGIVAYSGRCELSGSRSGTYALQNSHTIIPGILRVSIYVITPGQAEVRGLTLDGINSRWGSAVRSKVDPACWKGSDFEICVY